MNNGDRLMELAARYADGIATAQEVRELEGALRADASLRRKFVQYMNVDAALGTSPVALVHSDASPAPPASGRTMLRRWAMRCIAAAAIVIVAVVLWRPWTPSLRQPDQPLLPGIRTSSSVLLVAADHARWADSDIELPLRSGDMPQGLLRLESGVAEFRLPGGATAVVQGPAALRFPGPDQMFLQEGKALCRCPTPQSRITVTTSATQVVDLGTEFAVQAGPVGQTTRVAVVSGKVQVGAAERRILRTGESAEIGADRAVRLVPLPPEVFADLLKANSLSSVQGLGPNQLVDPSFETLSGESPWYRTQGHVELAPASPATVAIHARGHRFWPSVRQSVDTGDISGRLVVGSVDAVMPPNQPLGERQFAILKLAFINQRGEEFATSFRYFLHAGSGPGTLASTQVAAFAPPGTVKVEVQLMLNARGQSSGAVWFSNPRLVVASIAQTKPMSGGTRPAGSLEGESGESPGAHPLVPAIEQE